MNILTRSNAERLMLIWAAIWMFLAIKGVLSLWVFIVPLTLMALYFFPIRLIVTSEKSKNLVFIHSVYLSMVCVLLIMRYMWGSIMFISGMNLILGLASYGFLYWAYRVDNKPLLITTIIALIALSSVHA